MTDAQGDPWCDFYAPTPDEIGIIESQGSSVDA